MSYSSIIKKKCKCGCHRYLTLGYAGYSYNCAPQEIKDKVGSKQKVAARNKANKNALGHKLHEAQNVVDSEQELWFLARRGEMTGRCLFCGSKTEKHNDKTYKRSIAHLLAKRPTMFPSVATNKDNWLELCFYNNSCHTNFDNCMITLELLKDSFEWKLIVEKFKKVYPFIAEREKKNIPEILLKELA